MSTLVAKSALDFTAKAVMADNSIDDKFNLKSYMNGHKAILFFYPLDFTFVCPSEIIAFNNRLSEFAARNTKLIGVSVDSHCTHHAWKRTAHSDGGIGDIHFPLVSDLNKAIGTAYGVLNEDTIALRATFLIDEKFIVRHALVNDLPIGRDVEESLRVIDALDHHNKHGEVCPAGWTKGKDAIEPTADGIANYLTSNVQNL